MAKKKRSAFYGVRGEIAFSALAELKTGVSEKILRALADASWANSGDVKQARELLAEIPWEKKAQRIMSESVVWSVDEESKVRACFRGRPFSVFMIVMVQEWLEKRDELSE